MKKRYILLTLFVLIFLLKNVYAENVKVCFVQKDGAKIEKEYDSSNGVLVLFDSGLMKTVSFDFENQQSLGSIRVLELQKLSFLDNMGFLDMFPNLEELYIGYGIKCTDLNLQNIKKVKLVELYDTKILLK